MKPVGTFLTLAAAIYLATAALMYFAQDGLLFLPNIPGREIAATPAAVGLPYEETVLTTEDGVSLSAWWVPATQARATVVHFHGNAGNIGDRLELLQIFNALGLNVLLFDYRGYGKSTGSPSEDGVYRDAQAVWRHLTRERGLAPEQIVLHGQSLGGAVACWLAAHERPAALILESSFTSAPDLAAELYPWLPVRLLARLRFNTRELLEGVTAPVLVIHSRDDEIIPYAHGQRLFEAAREPKRMLEIRGDHNGGFWISREVYESGLRAFLDSLRASEPVASEWPE